MVYLVAGKKQREKQLGAWSNDGTCVATGDDASCGPGNQKQTRTCTDGTVDKCTANDNIEQTISCSDAGTGLPECTCKDGSLYKLFCIYAFYLY